MGDAGKMVKVWNGEDLHRVKVHPRRDPYRFSFRDAALQIGRAKVPLCGDLEWGIVIGSAAALLLPLGALWTCAAIWQHITYG